MEHYMNAVFFLTSRGEKIAERIQRYVADPALSCSTVCKATALLDDGMPLEELCRVLIEIEHLRRAGQLGSPLKYFNRRLAELAHRHMVRKLIKPGFEPGFRMVISLVPGTFVPAVAVRLSLDRITTVHVN
jgi:hypothetical protein